MKAQFVLSPESPVADWVRESGEERLAEFEAIPAEAWADYMARYEELEAAGKYPYNSEFEDLSSVTAMKKGVYLCQCRRRYLDDLAEREWYAENGYRDASRGEPYAIDRHSEIVVFGGGERKHYDNARLVHDEHGVARYILPKRKRNRGVYLQWGTCFGGSPLGTKVMVKA